MLPSNIRSSFSIYTSSFISLDPTRVSNTTMEYLNYALIIGGYLFGSISSAIIVCKLMGLPDPRTLGSNNPGATNVLRFGGKKAAAITLFGDIIKGVIPVLVARLLDADNYTLIYVGFAAFIGHLYPVFFGFSGGKGVATTFGMFVALHWQIGLAIVATWLVIAKGFKISSLSALIAMALAPVYDWWFTAGDEWSPRWIYVTILITVILTWRHRSNIQNLIKGSEDAIGTDAE